MSILSWDNRRPARRIARDALLCVCAMLFSYLESLIPILPIPGFKLGLANVIVMLVFFCGSATDAAWISFLRVLLVGLLFTGPISLCFSLCGAVCSYLTMLLIRRFAKERFSFIGISVLCAAAHNFGQTLAAAVFFGGAVFVSYLPWLLIASVPFGIITGSLIFLFVKKTEKVNIGENKCEKE